MTITRRDYTGRGFTRFLEKLDAYLSAEHPQATNDPYEDHILQVMKELISYGGDNLAFYLDMAFNEVMWDTVGHRKNIVALAKLLGYSPRGISSAQVTLSATTDPYTGTLSIPKGTQIPTSESGVFFEVTQNYAINEPETSFDVEAVQGITRIDTNYSDGTTSQRYTSVYSRVSSSVTPVVRVDGVEWEEVPFLYDVLAGNYYELSYTTDERIQITFGDGVHGNTPPDTVPIETEYVVSMGSDGNVPVGSISTTIQGTVSGSPHDVAVVNNEAASGGAPEETVEEIRNNAPIYFQSLGVVTTGKDLRGFIEAAAGVDKSQVTVDPSTKIVRVYVVASGYTTPSDAFLGSLRSDIQEVLVMGAILGIEAATFPTIDITSGMFIKPNYSVEEVTDNVYNALQEYFTPEEPSLAEKTIGSDIYMSDLVRLLDEVEGVDHVDLVKLARTPEPWYVVWSENAGIIDSPYLGTNSVEETWTVTFTSPTTFELLGSVSGLQANVGTVGTPYATDPDPQGVSALGFTLVAGSNPNQAGDYATIRVSRYVNSVTIEDGEFALQGTMNFTYNYVS